MAKKKRFGWIPVEERTNFQHECHERALAFGLPYFTLRGTYHEESGRFSLWKAFQQILVRNKRIKEGDNNLPFNHQVTGSCVGAGGGNMLKVLMCVEIINGDQEEYQTIWWPYTYGKSRLRAGMRTPGEGSLGSTWAHAVTKDGTFSIEQKSGLPEFRDASGWEQLSSAVERSWSDGDARQSLECDDLAKNHLVTTYAPIRNSDEGKAAISNGYPLTCASNFGTRTIRPRGNPEVNIAEYDDRWPHQMSINECWDHPTEGLIFYIQNNWGKNAHKSPTQGEPWGGFYVKASVFDRICSEREVFAFSAYNGFKAREIDWLI